MLQRIGMYKGAVNSGPQIWVHAVSVGESTAAVPLIRGLLERYPTFEIVVTTTTLTGSEAVTRLLGSAVRQVYFPFDVPWIVRRFLKQYPANMLIILETELWPNTIAECQRMGIPVVLANARLSERSRSAYLRVAKLSRELVQGVNCIVAQSFRDADRFRTLGAIDRQITVSGSLKFDLELPASLHEQAEALRYELGVNRAILMLGSTREGEEALLFTAVTELKQRFGSLLVVLAPRHPERFDVVADACAEAGFKVARRSQQQPCGGDIDIYLLDTMGELPRFYAAADVAFVGGSLLPFGGHNVLEPAALGTPVISGPHMHNFVEIGALLRDNGVMQQVEDANGVVDAASAWLGDSNERDRIGTIGREIVRKHRGATEQTLEIIEAYLPRRLTADTAAEVAHD